MIHKERMLREFFELVQIPCSTRQERQVADLLTKKLEGLGFSVTEDDAGKILGGTSGNLIATLPATKKGTPVLMLTAHMDCVEPCGDIHPRIEDGIIRSDGNTILGADDKAGVTSILEALRVIDEEKIPHGAIQVVFTVAEEGGVNGSKNMNRSLLTADFGYTLDTGGHPGKIVSKAPGQDKLFIKIKGKAAHAGLAPEKGINAITAAGIIMADLPYCRIDEETTFNIGTIRGGKATNIVPDLVEIAAETRSRNKEKLAALTKRICTLFEEGAARTGTEISIEISHSYDPYSHDPEAPVVHFAAQAAEKLGFPVQIVESGGGSDANFYNTYGVPCAVLGVGMTNAHTTEEHIAEQDLYDAAALTLQIIKDTAAIKTDL